MALEKQIKNGGPYNKKEQDERRIQVFELYYNKNYPIVKIANVLNVNRNTISEDVKHWNMQFSEEIQHVDVSTWMTSHLLRLESQKMRILEQAEKCDQIQLKLGFEKMALELESKIGQTGLELIKNKEQKQTDEDPEKETREFVQHLINLKKNKECLFSYDEILFEILKFKKCDEDESERFFYELDGYGLDYSIVKSNDEDFYDMKKFAEIREYPI